MAPEARVRLDDDSIVETDCSAYPTGPVGGLIVGDVLPVRYLASDPSLIEVDRDAMVAAKSAGLKSAEEGLVKLAEESIARDQG